MRYHCVDAGSAKCPCILMENGQCYTCRMAGEGICACGEDWRGSCPYTEWLQQGMQIQAAPRTYTAPLIGAREYGPHLTVVTLSVPRGLAQSCRALGTYIIAESLGWQIPLSVLRSTDTADTAPHDHAAGDRIEIALQPAGPKSRALLQDRTAPWRIRGPFYGGLVGTGGGSLRPGEPLSVIAKGTAIAPFINMIDSWYTPESQSLTLWIDEEKLTAEFLADYLQTAKGERIPWQPIRLAAEMERASALLRSSRQILFLASPYYTAQAKAAFLEPDENAASPEKPAAEQQLRPRCLLLPNHANICCGIGICGACSETDADGVTLRKCKCAGRTGVIE